ncbi:AtpZ/AtpI family protein, partial [Mesorhizobium sp. M7A.F.Ca.CA.004.04.1.1]
MADKNGPDGTGKTGRGNQHEPDIRDDDLERRRRDLEASLATRRPGRLEGKDDAKAGSVAGYGQALKLSSEFIAGVVVGAGIGWIIDRLAGTSPWGLIVFLLLGFGAGVLNV